MEWMTALGGLAVALLLTIGCEGAPSQNAEARSSLADPHIVMGHAAHIQDFPYQISIGIEYLNDDIEVMIEHRCGGAIVSEDYVITAAHCIDPRISGSTSLKLIRAGSTTLTPIGWGAKIHKIADVKQHSKFSMDTIDYDIGVIKVSNKFVFSDQIRPIAVPPAGEGFLDYYRNATVSGWGQTQPDDPTPKYDLQVAEIPLVTRTTCRELYLGAPAGFPKEITTRMLCGAGTGNGGPCHGDSGGPLVHKGNLVGVVSWGIRCNHPTSPTVFTNLLNDEIRGFVEENTGI